MNKPVKCPQCGKTFELTAQSKCKPFCSERCQLIDLGAWADGSYSIAAEDSPMSEQTSDTETEH